MTFVEEAGPTWADQRQMTMHTHTHTLIPNGNLERLINLTVMLSDCGRKQEYPERTRACTERTCRKTIGWDSSPGPSCCKATVLTAAPVPLSKTNIVLVIVLI
ncbi:hypothetical protein CRENBAI_004863 [Crenichthys baileyi]|uniref:Uncharacterized protein n=1 Tax=Crenichthys baileyi TaxID=28760 RepID=A0AAV9RNE5_9TELE